MQKKQKAKKRKPNKIPIIARWLLTRGLEEIDVM
jgi:hypothetical protein